MKTILIMILCVLLLAGCSAQETFETILDDPAVSASATAARITLSLPEEAATPSAENADGSRLYLCDGYTVTVQTLAGGDVDRTLREISGFSKDALTVMQTVQNQTVRYETVWSAAGEGGDQTCRAVILDDGKYHYAVTVMAPYTSAGELRETWQNILSSVTLSID